MIEINDAFSCMFEKLNPVFTELGFNFEKPDGYKNGDIPVFERNKEHYFEYSSSKAKVRLLLNEKNLRLLIGSSDAKSEDDSDYNLNASFLLDLSDFDEKEVKSTCNDIEEVLRDDFGKRQNTRKNGNIKVQPNVTKSQVKSGSLLYDPATLAIRLAAIYPSLKDDYKKSMQYYGEFLCEDFFVNYVNPLVENSIHENNPAVLKKLFNILNEIFTGGSNETQDVIVVTMLASYKYSSEEYRTVVNLMNDDLNEPFIRVYRYLNRSKSARMRLENPPKYKPKKKKKQSAFYKALTGTGNGITGS